MCKQCELNPVYRFTNKRSLCKTCFIRYFQKKFLYTIKKFSMIKKGDIVGHESKNDFRSVVLGDVLKFYASRAPVRIEYNSKNKKNKITKLAVSITTDILAIEIIEALMRGNLKELHIRPVERNIIKPLYLFLDEEVLLYAKLKKLKFKKINLKKEKISIFVDKLETKHPELKRAIVNSYLELSY